MTTEPLERRILQYLNDSDDWKNHELFGKLRDIFPDTYNIEIERALRLLIKNHFLEGHITEPVQGLDGSTDIAFTDCAVTDDGRRFLSQRPPPPPRRVGF